ncbi:hypothetical protein N0V93_006489 [Gnomoniopsis smithogilvyi]|uniref:NAD-dependent epimerase/dehydratase domain-containing protein n=1 Tax=Gnomoniopsis smithogilvyi TaxID=1191159 RepID=A0A9W8YPS6_9PEZI|nr:hypothetical protein N0V93_006489 [Gnomoniopsis smithogilvyi]
MAISSSPPGLTLITGATGHIGFRTLVHALRANLMVRVSVRSEAKAVHLLSRVRSKVPSLDLGPYPTYQSDNCNQWEQLTFAIIPNISLDGAYDEAMDGVTHVIHIASPLATGSRVPPIDCDLAENHFIKPAVQGTVSLLEAADRCGTVRRVVITSSIAALVPVSHMEGTEARPSHKPVKPTDRVSFTPGPYQSEYAAYANSKIAALEAAESWYERERPAFDVIHLHPSFVLGRNDMVQTAADCMKGTNAMVLAMLLGRTFGSFAGATVHVDDVAKCHVAAAIDVRGVPGNASYILSQASRWNDAKRMAAFSFPKAMQSRVLVQTGSVDTIEVEFDTSLTQDTFDLRFQSFKSQVKSLTSQYLALKSSKTRRGEGICRDVHIKQLEKTIGSQFINV